MKLCDELEARQAAQEETHTKLGTAALAALSEAEDAAAFEEARALIADNFELIFDSTENVAALQQSVLQLAVQGRLVPQNPADEPASVLLERIAAEKQRLVKEGKIRKSKPQSSIIGNELPYKLPDGWIWVCFPDIGEFGRGKSKHRPRNDPSLFIDGKYPFIQTGDVARANGKIKTYFNLYNEKGLNQSRIWPEGTLCITIAANIADTAILGFDACFPDSVVGFIPTNEIGNSKYFEYFLRTIKSNLNNYAPSTAQKNINLSLLEKILVTLPPRNMILKIVVKVDALMKLCDELDARITRRQEIQTKLIASIVAGASGC
ncbi:MAG: restriction endonuclease subunit S [Bacteroidales bacterium]|nr:restriction endonuclease subunit S [Bacteroidales bacterium]